MRFFVLNATIVIDPVNETTGVLARKKHDPRYTEKKAQFISILQCSIRRRSELTELLQNSIQFNRTDLKSKFSKISIDTSWWILRM